MLSIQPGATHNHGNYSNLTICDHLLLQDILSCLRMEETSDEEFARLLERAAPLLAYEALRNSLSKEIRSIVTPVGPMQAPLLADRNIILISILGAGQALATQIRRELLPEATLGYLAMRRDEVTLKPTQSYERLPSRERLTNSLVLVLDPMLATGGSSSAAIAHIKEKGARRIQLVTLIAAPEGVQRMLHDHPDVKVLTVSLDDHLNEKGYIVPGLGDAGDRYHNTAPAN